MRICSDTSVLPNETAHDQPRLATPEHENSLRHARFTERTQNSCVFNVTSEGNEFPKEPTDDPPAPPFPQRFGHPR